MQTILQERVGKAAVVMSPMSRRKAGLIGGAFLASWHAGWCALVALGWAQPLIDFVLWLHFLSVPVQVEPFGFGRALGLVGFTFGVGYALGWTFIAARYAAGRR